MQRGSCRRRSDDRTTYEGTNARRVGGGRVACHRDRQRAVHLVGGKPVGARRAQCGGPVRRQLGAVHDQRLVGDWRGRGIVPDGAVRPETDCRPRVQRALRALHPATRRARVGLRGPQPRCAGWSREVRLDELGGEHRDYRVPVPAQSSHTAGKPISHRLCAGFNTPDFAGGEGDEVEVAPCAWLFRPRL